MFFIYVIVSESKGLRFYVGMTENVEKRLIEHNNGKTKSTKGYTPWKFFLLKNRVLELKQGKERSI
jgi:putative endonuclease